MHKYSYFGLTFALSTILSTPTAWAATPQQILNNDLAAFNARDGYHVNGQLVVNVHETLLKSAPASYQQGPQSSSVTMDFQARALPKQNGLQDGEGRFALTKAGIQTGDQKYELTDPVKLQWIKVGPDAYWRIAEMPSVITDFLKGFVDLTPYIGQWVKGSISNAGSSIALLPQLGLAETLNAQTEAWASKKYFLITRTEKKYKNAQNEDMARVRIAINRNSLYKEYLANLNTAYRIKDKKTRTDTIHSLRTQYNDTIKELKKLSMAANLNLTKQRLERLELGLAQKDPKQDCTTNPKTSKSTCRTIGYTTIQVMGGLNFLSADDSPIIAPEGALEISDLANLMSTTTNSGE